MNSKLNLNSMSNHGREAKSITFGGEDGSCILKGSFGCDKIIFWHDQGDHADYGKAWLIVLDETGKETSRHSANKIESIMWL